MNQEMMEKAREIISHRDSLQKELARWSNLARDGIVSPLSFRMGGSGCDIDHMSKEAFDQFRGASIAYLKAGVAELDAQFASL